MGVGQGLPENLVLPIGVCGAYVFGLLHILVVEVGEFLRTQHINPFGHCRPGKGAAVIELGRFAGPVFGGDDYHPVRTPGTINSRGGSVFEYVDGHDIGRVEEVQGIGRGLSAYPQVGSAQGGAGIVKGHPVYHKQRAAARSDRARTPDGHVGGGTRGPARGHHGDPCQLPLQQLLRRIDDAPVEGFFL